MGEPRGRYLIASLTEQSRQLTRRTVVSAPRARRDVAEWSRYRLQGIEDTTREFRKVYAELDPPLQRLMTFAGNNPATGMLRWGNFAATLAPLHDLRGRRHGTVVPSPRPCSMAEKPDDPADSPHLFFLFPRGPIFRRDATTTAVLVRVRFRRRTHGGFAGLNPIRGPPSRIVLGDSFMQGCSSVMTRRLPSASGGYLQVHLKTRPRLNTGHLGYSPEQEYYTLKEYAGKFKPQFVILGLFANDFGGSSRSPRARATGKRASTGWARSPGIAVPSGSCCSRFRLRWKARSSAVDSPGTTRADLEYHRVVRDLLPRPHRAVCE